MTIPVLVPRIRRHRTGRVVAIRCTTCRTWRKPRHVDRHTGTCHTCSYTAAHRRVTARNQRRT